MYNAGLINLRVTAFHVMPHHTICGLLRRTRTTGLVVTNIKGTSTPAIVRAWTFGYADGRIDFQSGQMENFNGAPQHWPYGLRLRPVGTQAVM